MPNYCHSSSSLSSLLSLTWSASSSSESVHNNEASRCEIVNDEVWEQVKGGKCRRWSMKSVNTQSGRHSIWPFNEECRHSIWLFNEVSTLNLAFQWKVSTFIFSEKPTPVSALNFADKKCTLSVDESLNLWKVKTQACWLAKVGYYKVSAGDWWRALQKCQRKQVSAWLIGNSPRKSV